MAFFSGNYGGIAKLCVISRSMDSLHTLSPQNIHTQFPQKCSILRGKRNFLLQNTSGFSQSYGRGSPQPKALRVMAATEEGGTADDKELQELRDLYGKKDSQRLEQRDARNKTFKEIQDISLAIKAAGSGEEAARKMLLKRKLERKLDSVTKKLKQINKEVRAIRGQKEQLEKQEKAKKKSKNSRDVEDEQESESDLQKPEVEVMEAAMGIIYSSLLTQRSVQV
ncbi:hypothetical protein CYMTET_22452 [Cymbomonas tetramitiformis]|uniref:Uncharacterized protein n=1 Tax=Cymbomonas tetramitiformis TaxID=36881 RepID=A0AAE0G0E0_9CHLO|nr:hypothetical protein CYMTET_22452 [Cymbomonas tetramitiformis]